MKLFNASLETQLELPRQITGNSVKSDLGCTSRIYFDNMSYKLTLAFYNVALMSQNSCQHNNKCVCSKTNDLNEVYVFFQ